MATPVKAKRRYRKVHCLIWADDKFPFISDDAQLVWFHAYTSPFSTGIGIFAVSVEALAANKRWDLKRYLKGFNECIEKGFIKYDARFQVVYFPKFFEWNTPSNPNILKSMLTPWYEIPNCEIKALCLAELKGYAKVWGNVYLNVLETYEVTYTETGTGTGTGTGEEEPVPEEPVPEEPVVEDPDMATPDKICALYHELLPLNPKVEEMTTVLKKQINARIKEKAARKKISWWEDFFKQKIVSSNFLTVKFAADLTWITKPSNLSKIINNAYSGGGRNGKSTLTDNVNNASHGQSKIANYGDGE
jgi:hypothetical protein